MEWHTGSDRRKVDRRQGDRRQHATADKEAQHMDKRHQERRQADRRQHRRRQSARIVYPPDAAPKVLNINVRIINMSSRGIMFTRHAEPDESTPPIMPGGVIELKIQFHDREALDVQVKILRCRYDPESREEVFAGTMVKAIPAERISKEQAHLSKSFPNLCETPSG